MPELHPPPRAPAALSSSACWLVLVTAFLGWMCAGWQMAITSLAMRDAASSLLTDVPERVIGAWFGRLTCAFLLGAAAGGYLLGWAGDRFGRTRAMAFSILCYSFFSAVAIYAHHPAQLWLARFLCCLGVGGMWPNGIALVSEAWPNISRPMLAGAVGTSANLGIMILSTVAQYKLITADDWHWIMWLGATPFVLGVFVWLFVPESPNWLVLRAQRDAAGAGEPGAVQPTGMSEIFRPPLLGTTVLAIVLGAIPLFGGWGNSNWVMPWASKVGDPSLKAQLQLARSLPGTISSLLGGGLAALLGRRRSYFLLSIAALVSGEVLYGLLTPDQDRFWFLFWFAALGFFSGFYFGWLPLCLPELFPTRVRSMGAGVGFNWGRILTAVGVISAAEMLNYVEGDYGRIGRITSLVYALGMLVILFMPDTSQKQMNE